MLAAWLHDLSPFAIRFTDTFGVRWYGLSYVAAFVIGWLILRGLGRRGLTAIPPDRAGDAMMIVVLGTVLGGRLGYVLLGYDFPLLYTFTSDPPWWGLLAINKGGMASHGGMIGLIIAAWWISRGFRADTPAADAPGRIGRCGLLHVMDVLALMAPPGLLLGRLANFVNGELLGAIVSPPGKPGPWWTVQFPQELRGWVRPGVMDAHSHTPALDGDQRRALWDLVLDAYAHAGVAKGQTEAILWAGGREADIAWQHGIDLVIEQASRHRAVLETILASRHPSQLYQAAAEGLILGAVLWALWAKPRAQGLIAAAFFGVYGVLRIATEVWRLPDPQLGRTLGLSRGQWLSAGMLAVAAALAVWAIRRARGGEAKMGGWLGRGA